MSIPYKHISTEEARKGLPPTLYKYRSWNDDWHKTILTEQNVYLSRPTKFKDPLDCKSVKRYDLFTPVEIYDMYYNLSKKEHPKRDELDHRKHATEWFRKSPMFDHNYIKDFQKRYFEDFDDRFGVLCLTANKLKVEMWEKYAEDHKGFCVGFHTETLFNHLGGGGEVVYEDTLPDILPSDDDTVEFFKQVYFKEKKWKFEEEYRTHKFWPNPATEKERTIMLSQTVFKEIIFGHFMPEEQKREIKNTCKKERLVVLFFNAVLNNTAQEISVEPCL